jgi:hypothetical protein
LTSKKRAGSTIAGSRRLLRLKAARTDIDARRAGLATASRSIPISSYTGEDDRG